MKNIYDMNKPMFVCLSGVFAALCCVATMIAVPLPFGYFNLGDIFVIIAGWILGPIGAVAAAIGSTIADLTLGFAIYAPATFVIKGLDALIAYYTYKLFSGRMEKKPIPVLLSAIIAESTMIAGYFFFDAVVLGYGMGALASVPGNALQGVASIIGSSALFLALRTSKLFYR